MAARPPRARRQVAGMREHQLAVLPRAEAVLFRNRAGEKRGHELAHARHQLDDGARKFDDYPSAASERFEHCRNGGEVVVTAETG